MFALYRALLARRAARPLAVACALAWLAFTSYGLAIILVVHAATRSFGLAGAAVAAFSAGSGLMAPARGRFIDRQGPHRLVLFTFAHGCAASALVVTCLLHAPAVALLCAAMVAGGVAPPLIATARTMWTKIAAPDLIKSAHALNASLADAAQLLSPALTGALAAAFAPSLALAVLIVGATLAGAMIALTGRRRRLVDASAPAPPGRLVGVIADSPGLRTLVACDVAGGLWTGGLEVSVTALAARHGAAELAALPLSAMAVGGALASLWVGSRSVLPAADVRYLGGSLLVGASLPLAMVGPSVGSVTCIAVVVGAGVGVLGVALFELLDHVVAPERAVEAFTWLTTGQAAGSAAGAAGAGALVHGGTTVTFGVVGGCAVAAAAIAFIRRGTLTSDTSLDSAQSRRF
ncbi:MAG: MFS transporter [Solirubrobacteraceae bacterium]